jgi:hypothetical protein
MLSCAQLEKIEKPCVLCVGVPNPSDYKLHYKQIDTGTRSRRESRKQAIICCARQLGSWVTVFHIIMFLEKNKTKAVEMQGEDLKLFKGTKSLFFP